MIAFSAVPGERRHPLGKSIFISHNASGVAVGAEVFTRVKRKRRSVSKGSNVSPLVSGKMRLATILPVTICDQVVIGAGTVVTKDITVPGIYAGNPARLLRRL